MNIAGYTYKWEFVSYSDSEQKYYFRRVFQAPTGDPVCSINYISYESSFRCVPVYSELKGPSYEHPYGCFTYGVYYPFVNENGVSTTGYYASGAVELAFSSQEQYEHALACVLGNSSDFDDSGTGEGENSGTGENESSSDTSWLGSIGDWFSNLISKLVEFFSSVGEWFSSLVTKLGEWFSSVGEWFVNLGDRIGEFFTSLFDWFKLNLFTVDMDRVFATVDFEGKLRDKFGIFFEIGEALAGFSDKSVSMAAEPKIDMTLPEFLGGGTAVVLDLTSFASLFAFGKTLFRGVLWLGFAFWVLEFFSPKMHVG